MNEVAFSRESGPSVPLTYRPGESPAISEAQSVPVATQYMRIAMRWKWLILAAVAISLLVGVLVTLLATPLYTATTRLEISREGTRVVNVEDVQPQTSSIDNEFYQTQYSLLESQSLAERVARELRLADDPSFFAMFGHSDLLQETPRGPSLTGDRHCCQHIAVQPAGFADPSLPACRRLLDRPRRYLCSARGQRLGNRVHPG
jgi:hypothetical protein